MSDVEIDPVELARNIYKECQKLESDANDLLVDVFDEEGEFLKDGGDVGRLVSCAEEIFFAIGELSHIARKIIKNDEEKSSE